VFVTRQTRLWWRTVAHVCISNVIWSHSAFLLQQFAILFPLSHNSPDLFLVHVVEQITKSTVWARKFVTLFYFTVVSTNVDWFLQYLAHGILSTFATQQLLIYPPHLHTAATLPWEKSTAYNKVTIFPLLQTNITSQMRPIRGKGLVYEKTYNC